MNNDTKVFMSKTEVNKLSPIEERTYNKIKTFYDFSKNFGEGKPEFLFNNVLDELVENSKNIVPALDKFLKDLANNKK